MNMKKIFEDYLQKKGYGFENGFLLYPRTFNLHELSDNPQFIFSKLLKEGYTRSYSSYSNALHEMIEDMIYGDCIEALLHEYDGPDTNEFTRYVDNELDVKIVLTLEGDLGDLDDTYLSLGTFANFDLATDDTSDIDLTERDPLAKLLISQGYSYGDLLKTEKSASKFLTSLGKSLAEIDSRDPYTEIRIQPRFESYEILHQILNGEFDKVEVPVGSRITFYNPVDDYGAETGFDLEKPINLTKDEFKVILSIYTNSLHASGKRSMAKFIKKFTTEPYIQLK